MKKTDIALGISCTFLVAIPASASTHQIPPTTSNTVPRLAVASAEIARPSRKAAKAEATEKSEVVMPPGMTITAKTLTGTIAVTAVDDLTRSYTWEGATRSVEMWRRSKRWYGSLGLYYPGPGEHWKEHNGITRCVVEEGQQHFNTTKEALEWIHSQSWQPCVYRDDGLMVAWSKTLPRRQLSVDVWQIYINGKKPEQLPGSHNRLIVIGWTKPVSVYSSLVEAVTKNNLSAVRSLLNKGVNPNIRSSAGSPVLKIAIHNNYAGVAEALLNRGAHSDERGSDGVTPLLEAATRNNVEMVRLLLAKGAKVNGAFDRGIEKGATALTVAAMDGTTSLTRILLAAGADVNAQMTTGDTPIDLAASEGHQDVIEMLLKKGANVDHRNWAGTTPLMAAAMDGHLETVKFLLARGANINARDDKSRLSYERAAFMGDTETQKQLEKSGKLNIRHEDGMSALGAAQIGRNKEVIDLLKQAGAKEQ